MRTRTNLLNKALLAGLAILTVAVVACTSTDSEPVPKDEGSGEPTNSVSLGIPAPGYAGMVDEMIVLTDVETEGGGFEVHPAIENGKVIDGAGPGREGSIEPANSVSLGFPAPGYAGMVDEMIVLTDTEAEEKGEFKDRPF